MLSEAHYGISRAYLQQGRKVEADSALQKFQKLSKMENELQLYQQRVHNCVGRKKVEALCNLGAIYLKYNRSKQARQTYDRALQRDAACVEAYVGLGVVYTQQNEYQEGQRIYYKALDLNPELVEAHAGLGQIALHQQDLTNAEKHYQRAGQLKPNLPQVWINLGIVYAKQQKLADAVIACQKAVSLKPDLVQARMVLAAILVKQKKLEAAAEEYQKIIRLQPKDPKTYGKLVQLYIDNQIHLDVAISLAQTAIRLAPSSSVYLNQLAWIYYNTGRYVEAEKSLLKALQIDPNNQLYLEGLQEIRKILSQ